MENHQFLIGENSLAQMVIFRSTPRQITKPYPLVNMTKNYGKSPFLMENSLFLWPFSIAMSNYQKVPSGKHTKNYGKSPFLMGKLTISMAIFNSYVKLPEGTLW